MRISDWSSDVCSSDLIPLADRVLAVIVTAPRQRQIGDRLVGGLGIREWQAADPRLAARCFNDIAVRIEFRLALVLQRSFEEARSEEHTSELQSLMRTSYAVFCLQNKNHKYTVNDK